MKKIKLSRGRYALLDDEDYKTIISHKYKWGYNGLYATSVKLSNVKGKKYDTVFMHKLILPPPIGKEVDHINENKLDNLQVLCNKCHKIKTANDYKK